MRTLVAILGLEELSRESLLCVGARKKGVSNLTQGLIRSLTIIITLMRSQVIAQPIS